jgi:hypothetical protein
VRIPRRFLITAVLVLIFTLVAHLWAWPVHATALTNTYVRLSRMQASTATDFRLVFKTTTAAASGGKVVVQFYNAGNPAQFTINATQTVSSGSCAADTGATALPGSITAAGDNTAAVKTVTISSVGALTATTAYCVDLTSASAVTTPATTAGYITTVSTQTSGSATIDTTNIGLRVVSSDQVVVTAVVPPTFNFTLGATTDAFSANLDPTLVGSTGGVAATVTTNAAHGWIEWVKDLSQGLVSAGAGHTIATVGGTTPVLFAAGAEKYGLYGVVTTDSSGSTTVDAQYAGDATHAGQLYSGYKRLAFANSPTNGDVVTVKELAAIAGDTPSGNDYTDTLTVVAAGNF